MRVAQALHRRTAMGYSLIEALVVVALIGLFSVLAIPNFMQFYRSSRLKSSLRNFTSDVRWARQKAIAETAVVIISFPPPGASSTSYRLYRARLNTDGTFGGLTFFLDPSGEPIVRTLEEAVFFNTTNFTDTVNTTALRAGDANYRDIVFLTNGTLRAASGTPQVQMITDKPIPFPAFNINFSVAGGVRAVKP